MSIVWTRRGIGAIGVLGGLYGAYLVLSRQDLHQLTSAAIWMVGGVVLHDFVLAPVVVGVAWLLRKSPVMWHWPATVAAIVLGTLTVLAIPVLTGLGRRADNPTLLDRPYGWTWVVVAVVSVILVVIAGVVGSRRAGGGHGQGARGR